MPAAAPQATSKRRRWVLIFPQRPTNEASTAESCTSGPSRPMEPPEAMENIAEAHFTKLEREEM